MSLKKSFYDGTYTIPSRATIVTRAFTDEGIVGEVFAGVWKKNGREICNLIENQSKKVF